MERNWRRNVEIIMLILTCAAHGLATPPGLEDKCGRKALAFCLSKLIEEANKYKIRSVEDYLKQLDICESEEYKKCLVMHGEEI